MLRLGARIAVVRAIGKLKAIVMALAFTVSLYSSYISKADFCSAHYASVRYVIYLIGV